MVCRRPPSSASSLPADGPEPRSVRRLRGTGEPGALATLVGEGPAMGELVGHIERVLDVDVTVAVFGESGTGKELVARAIHEGGARRGGPFVAINCAAIPASLQESELFGHERGAFSGAVQTRRGVFEQAHGGTLFLDELGEMSPTAQAALLRTLQERTIRRVGGSADIPVDVRIVTATRRDLRAEVAAGRFREDLYFRLVVYPIELPPLRDRREDIPSLVEHALVRLQPREPRRVQRVSDEAMAALVGYGWPGNVRELLNVVQRAILMCTGEEIGVADVPRELRPLAREGAAASRRTLPVATAEPEGAEDGCPPPSSRDALDPCPLSACCRGERVAPLSDLERLAIERALSLVGGDVRRAAEMLGISRATLYRRLTAAVGERPSAPPGEPEPRG